MRLWSLHPQYLDTKGLVALWREGLLAKKVLEGKTTGYKHHPQLLRFKNASQPLSAINAYLQAVVHEAEQRGYAFDRSKIFWDVEAPKLAVTTGQAEYEKKHLLAKLQIRDPKRVVVLDNSKTPLLHPLFQLTDGDIEIWEIR